MKKAIIFLLHIPLAVFVMFEYYMFMWFWSGDGTFALCGCGISFIIYMALHIFAYFKVPNKYKKGIIYSAIILTPILSIVTVYSVLAPILGITIQIT